MRWWQGRFPLVVVASAVITIVALYFWWWPFFDGPWAPSNDPRIVQLHEVLPMLGGAVALAALQPRVHWIDAQSPRRIAVISTVSMAVVILGFAALPMFTRLLWSLGDWYLYSIPQDSILHETRALPTYPFFAAFALNIVAVLALTCGCVAALGRIAGPFTMFLWFGLLLVAQGQANWQGLAHSKFNSLTMEPTLPDVAIAATCLVLGLGVYSLSRGGARPTLFDLREK